jgi:hypothetical protein
VLALRPGFSARVLDATDGATSRHEARTRANSVFAAGPVHRSTRVITRPRPGWIDVIDGAGDSDRVNPKFGTEGSA